MADAKHGTARGSKRRRPLASKAPAPAARGLPSDELLAKIDSLDWEDTRPPAPLRVAPATVPAAPSKQTRGLLPYAVAAVVLSVGLLMLYQFFGTDDSTRLSASQQQVGLATPATENTDLPATSDTADAARLEAIEAQERERVAKLSQAVQLAEDKEKEKAKAASRAEKQRKAREEQARLEQEQLDRSRQLAEEARLRAERAAAEAHARATPPPAPAPVPRGPSSPQELCAGETNFFARGVCEWQACGKPAWQNHPYCIKRIEEQAHRVGQSN
jgi:hypothetical protein